MPRYIEGLNECTDPAPDDVLWVVDASAPATDKDRKLAISQLARLAAANTFAAGQRVNGMQLGLGDAPGMDLLLPAVLRLRSQGTMQIAGPGAQPITGFAWGVLVPIIEIPGIGLAAGLVVFDGVAATVVAGGQWFTGTVSTPNKINFYVSGGNAVAQNMHTGITVNAHFVAIAP